MTNGLLLVPALYGVAIGLSALLLRVLPAGALPPAAGEEARGRFTTIDGLRGLLAYGVFIHHGVITWNYLHTGQWALPDQRLFIHLGQSGVALFFMVTAFLFWTRILDARTPTDWLGFVVSRFYRLYPVYLLAASCVVLIALASTGFSPAVGAVTLLRSLAGWASFKAPPVNGMENAGQIVAYATWSLPYELLFYAALPGLAFLFAGARRSGPALASLAATLAVLLYFRSFNPAVLAGFGGGFAAACWIRRPGLAAFARSPAGALLALAGLACTVAFCDTAYAPLPMLGLTVVFLAVASGQGFGALLTRRPILWLGEISYGVYLLHGIVLWVAITGNGALPAAVRSDGTLYAAVLALVGGLVVLAASLVHLTVERPGIALGRKQLARLRAKAAQRAGRRALGAADA
ncbi:peptidoglycan/LPS O-acetylase OafA/YrhL [Azospirillum agricola]|uniref:acyltransferase family protein n=1 Tax=Azospirillum agricola TaxID=1720247 RepID=UPI001AE4A156|nr:acyltransferase [Azospirillum agricola]MBP2228498.1 peptidoglycan/LPS O-acetylase OafA/YrhL [Azospirillum agricola]